MNKYTNMLKPEAEARIRTEIGMISGLAIERITAMPPANMNAMGLLKVQIRLTGWSPSLNLMQMVWKPTVFMDHDATKQGDLLLERLSHRMDIQRQRFAEGLSLGTAAPFDIARDDDGREQTKWGHILVDRALAGMIEGRRAGDFDREVSDAVWDLHQSDQGEFDGTETILSGECTNDDCEPIGSRMLKGRELRQDHEIAPGFVFDGAVLRIPGGLPETVLAAAVGQRLGGLVEVPTSIADRKIIGASEMEGRVGIHIESDLVPAAELLATFEAAA